MVDSPSSTPRPVPSRWCAPCPNVILGTLEVTSATSSADFVAFSLTPWSLSPSGSIAVVGGDVGVGLGDGGRMDGWCGEHAGHGGGDGSGEGE